MTEQLTSIKLCRFCGEQKPLSEFSSDKSKKSGLHSKCKECKKIYSSSYWRRPEVKERELIRRKTDPRYVEARKYRQGRYHSPRSIERLNEWKRERRAKNPKWRLHESMSARIRHDLKNGKAGLSLQSILDGVLNYTIERLVKHLEKQFLPGMTWANYGEWHIDHKIPVSAFNFNSISDIDFKRCWELKNLRPLWKAENLAKNDTLSAPFQPSLLNVSARVALEKPESLAGLPTFILQDTSKGVWIDERMSVLWNGRNVGAT